MNKTISFSEAIRQALIDEMNADSNVFLLGEDIATYGGAFGITKGLVELFSEKRIIDTPISEGGFTGVAIGAALLGSRPVVEFMFMDFIALASDQILNQAAKISYVYGEKCPVVFRAVNGAGRSYGPTHSQNLEAWFAHIPGLMVIAPATIEDAYSMTRAAIQSDVPVLMVEHKKLYPLKAHVESFKLSPLNTSNILKTGDDITIISYSYMVQESLKAATILEQHDISAEVIDLRILNPIYDEQFIESVKKTGRAVIVTEENKSASIASEIAARISEKAFDYLDAPINRITLPDTPIPASPHLEHHIIPTPQSIVETILKFDWD